MHLVDAFLQTLLLLFNSKGTRKLISFDSQSKFCYVIS